MANNVYDVAKFLLGITGEVSTWKLQKLIYYSQAWNTVWNDQPLFPEPIQAWANGPVCPALYEVHKGLFSVSQAQIAGDASRLSDAEQETVRKVVTFYGNYSGQQLSDITHSERPWLIAREGLGVTERGAVEITLENMAEFYSSIPQASN